jgi:hypothetical protein
MIGRMFGTQISKKYATNKALSQPTEIDLEETGNDSPSDR